MVKNLLFIQSTASVPSFEDLCHRNRKEVPPARWNSWEEQVVKNIFGPQSDSPLDHPPPLPWGHQEKNCVPWWVGEWMLPIATWNWLQISIWCSIKKIHLALVPSKLRWLSVVCTEDASLSVYTQHFPSSKEIMKSRTWSTVSMGM